MLVAFFFLLFSTSSFAYTGRVAIPSSNRDALQIVTRSIDTDSSSSLHNSFIEFKTNPENLFADSDGCFCFPENDERFAYVQAFFHATEQVRSLNASFSNLKAGPVHIKIELAKTKVGEAPHGAAHWSDNSVTIWYSQPLLDPSLLAHEIGHLAHGFILNQDLSTFLIDPRKDLNGSFSQLNVIEGIANLFSTFYTKDSLVGRYGYATAAINLDAFLKLESLPTIKDVYDSRILSFSSMYPTTANLYRQLIASPPLPGMLDQPEPYVASAVFTQPVWMAYFNLDQTQLLAALACTLDKVSSISSVNQFVLNLKSCSEAVPQLKAFFDQEFGLRGFK